MAMATIITHHTPLNRNHFHHAHNCVMIIISYLYIRRVEHTANSIIHHIFVSISVWWMPLRPWHITACSNINNSVCVCFRPHTKYRHKSNILVCWCQRRRQRYPPFQSAIAIDRAAAEHWAKHTNNVTLKNWRRKKKQTKEKKIRVFYV